MVKIGLTVTIHNLKTILRQKFPVRMRKLTAN